MRRIVTTDDADFTDAEHAGCGKDEAGVLGGSAGVACWLSENAKPQRREGASKTGT
jgi:hypothetical protein